MENLDATLENVSFKTSDNLHQWTFYYEPLRIFYTEFPKKLFFIPLKLKYTVHFKLHVHELYFFDIKWHRKSIIPYHCRQMKKI